MGRERQVLSQHFRDLVEKKEELAAIETRHSTCTEREGEKESSRLKGPLEFGFFSACFNGGVKRWTWTWNT